jgi:NAD(P)-dependent dehydrogenase (short-subunit alcohol dehydrogenase family)
MLRRYASTTAVLLGKVLVESPFRYRRFGCESFNTGGVDALAIEQLGSGVQDALARATATLAGRVLRITLLTHDLKYTERFTSEVKRCSVAKTECTPIGLLGVDMKPPSPVVLITGVSSGIGRAVASALAAKDFQVFGTSRNPDRTEPIPGVELMQLDVTDAASVAKAVATVIARAGRIDILVNNAGFGVIGAAEESSVAQAQQLFDTNFFGLVRLTREVLPHLRAQGSGRIINISSVLGFLPAPYGALYAASKHAVEGYSESLDHETREFGVRVLVVEPGYTRTSFETNAAEADSPIDSYATTRERVRQVLTQAVRLGDDPAVVAEVVLKAATSRAPKLRYPAGPMARRVSLLKSFAPATLLDKGIRKMNKLTTTPKPNRNTAPNERRVPTPPVGNPS